jgi:hypothetical protein
MGKTIVSLLGSILIVASMASAVTAAEHHTRHHHPYVSQSVRPAVGSYHPSPFNPEDQNAFGTITPTNGRQVCRLTIGARASMVVDAASR